MVGPTSLFPGEITSRPRERGDLIKPDQKGVRRDADPLMELHRSPDVVVYTDNTRRPS